MDDDVKKAVDKITHTIYKGLEWSIGPPQLTNMNKITNRQAAIDSSMPGEFKKWN